MPKPVHTGTIDRASVEGKRPSGIRSNSAEPPRTTIGGNRLSRETSSSKIPMNRRSRSQQGDNDRRYGQVPMTPLRSSNYRPTITPVRTPSEDRSGRNWQASLDRAIASVTAKDNRPISNAAWQRANMAHVQEFLAMRYPENSNTKMLIRPLTIARFVDITSSLLQALMDDFKLNNDNYITRLPHTVKRLLYPGTVSKSWLRTVNTLHAFPQALALIAYLVDLLSRIETPIDNVKLYVNKDEHSCLRIQYLRNCWIRFQVPGYQVEDINEEYLQELKLLLGNDEKNFAELQQNVNEMELSLEDEAELAAQADEARRVECRSGLLAGLRTERATRVATRGVVDESRGKFRALVESQKTLETEIERANATDVQLKRELEEQPMSVIERMKLLEEIDYANRVVDSKQVLAQQISKMVLAKETGLASWQKKTLDNCVEYNHGLIHLSTAYPEMAHLAVEEKELMGEDCSRHVAKALEAMKEKRSALLQAVNARERERMTDNKRRANILGEVHTELHEVRANLEREQALVENESAREVSEVNAFSSEQRNDNAKIEEFRPKAEEYVKAKNELAFWEKQNNTWVEKLSAFQSYIAAQKEDGRRKLEEAKEARATLAINAIAQWNAKLDLVQSINSQ